MSVYQYSINIGQAYPSTLVFIPSLKMDQYPFRPWDEKLGAKALLHQTNCNRPDIAFVDTLLAQISATSTIHSDRSQIRYPQILR